MTDAPTKLETAGAVLRVTLNRPEKRNAINERMIAELRAALDKASGDAEVRVILLAGKAPDFCAGMDLNMMDLSMMAEPVHDGALEFLESAERLAGVYRALRNCPKPVVAAVRGRALGGGCGLAMACDVILATESSKFGFPEVNIGFVPAIVMSLLRRSVGEKRAFELLASGEPVPAREACDIGMITKVYPDTDFDASVAAYVTALATKSASAMSLTKKLLYAIDGMSFEAALDAGAQINAIARTTKDAQSGFAQFGKRKR